MLPATGPTSDRRSGSIVDLLRAIPYLLVLGVVPPLTAMNELLRKGVMDAGMSGGARWEPFELSADEWPEVAAALEAQGAEVASTPDWVQTFSDWYIWMMAYRFGVAVDEHRRLREDVQTLEAARDAAAEAGAEAEFVRLHVAVFRADQALGDFLRRYLPWSHV